MAVGAYNSSNIALASKATARPLYQPPLNTSMPSTRSSKAIPLDIEDVSGTGRLAGITWEQATELPAAVRERMPSPAMAIPLLLRYSFPAIIKSDTVLPSAVSCIESSAPKWNVETLLESTIPPVSWRAELDTSLRLLWEGSEGAESIAHPTDTALTLPIWILPFWDRMVKAMEEQVRWRRAIKWVVAREDCPQRAAVLDVIGRTPWGLTMESISTVDPDRLAGAVATLLSLDWVSESHMQVVSDWLNAVGHKEWFAPGFLLSDVLWKSSALPDEDVKENPYLLRMLATITSRGASNILMPVHVNGNHWIVVHVNLNERTFSFGVYFCLATVDCSSLFGPANAHQVIPLVHVRRTN